MTRYAKGGARVTGGMANLNPVIRVNEVTDWDHPY
jgi:hypothetical protein